MKGKFGDIKMKVEEVVLWSTEHIFILIVPILLAIIVTRMLK